VGKKARRSRKRKPRQLIPYWNKRERVLFLGRHVVKRFRKPAPDQEAILDSEQELGWPLWMDDPLSRKAGHDPKRRLNQTLKNLNRGQNAPRVLFRGDGTGTRLGWSIKWESTPFRHHSERSKVERSLGI